LNDLRRFESQRSGTKENECTMIQGDRAFFSRVF
jgi:hypothetical protein